MKSFMKYHAIIDFSEAQRESLKNSSNPAIQERLVLR